MRDEFTNYVTNWKSLYYKIFNCKWVCDALNDMRLKNFASVATISFSLNIMKRARSQNDNGLKYLYD
jgi:hypothetical protein